MKAIPVNEGIIKLGFSISASTGNAVQRNRARRRLKNALREILSEGVYKPFTGIFFINAVKVNRMAWRELLNALKNIFKNTSDNCLKYKVKDL